MKQQVIIHWRNILVDLTKLVCILLVGTTIVILGYKVSHPAGVQVPSEARCMVLMSESQSTFNASSQHSQLQEVMCEWLTQNGHSYGPQGGNK